MNLTGDLRVVIICLHLWRATVFVRLTGGSNMLAVATSHATTPQRRKTMFPTKFISAIKPLYYVVLVELFIKSDQVDGSN